MSQPGSPEMSSSMSVSHAAIQGSPETTARMLGILESWAYTPDEIACLLGFGTSEDLMGPTRELNDAALAPTASQTLLEFGVLDAADRWTVLEMARAKEAFEGADLEGMFGHFDDKEGEREV